MKKVYITIIASGLVAAVASAGTSVNIDFASAYVFRGVTVFDDLVIQIIRKTSKRDEEHDTDDCY